MPLVCIERTVSDHSISCVVADSKSIIYLQRERRPYLTAAIRKSAFLCRTGRISTVNEQLTGFLDAMYDAGVHCDDSNIVKMNLYNNKDCERAIIRPL